MLVHVAVPPDGSQRTEKMCPGVVGVAAVKPPYEIHAWFASSGSTVRPVGYRSGSFAESESRRMNVTALAGSASAFDEMNTRPFVVAAHSVDVSEAVRSTIAIAPPARSVPQPFPVSEVGPSGSQSPH